MILSTIFLEADNKLNTEDQTITEAESTNVPDDNLESDIEDLAGIEEHKVLTNPQVCIYNFLKRTSIVS